MVCGAYRVMEGERIGVHRTAFTDAASTIERLERENAELRRDAERYQVMKAMAVREAPHCGLPPVLPVWSIYIPGRHATFDDAIDAALAK